MDIANRWSQVPLADIRSRGPKGTSCCPQMVPVVASSLRSLSRVLSYRKVVAQIIELPSTPRPSDLN